MADIVDALKHTQSSVCSKDLEKYGTIPLSGPLPLLAVSSPRLAIFLNPIESVLCAVMWEKEFANN
jgi:hypothetical protein